MLAETQARLQEHFQSLSIQREALDYPVYALEHGLETSEILTIRTALAADLRRYGGLRESYWLLWVIVATEIGYAYDGDEYWTSFVQAIPDWGRYGDRQKFRECFFQFARRYHGFRPSGRWAQHFSIIAWPIAHAILPRDLQGHFARHLYERRYELAREANISRSHVEAILANGELVGSSRFRDFIEQPELAARLLLALRDDDVRDVVPAISRSTLGRLISDLEQRHTARDWLREARKVLREARIRELIGSEGSVVTPGRADGRTTQESLLATRLIARQTSDAGWLLGIRLPALAALLLRADISARDLDRTRVRFSDCEDEWLPGRALTSFAGIERRIYSLPDMTANPVLTLERDLKGLRSLLDDPLRIKGTAPWVLRIQDDGVARQVVGNHVRAGQAYLLIGDAPLPPSCVRDLRMHEIDSGVVGAHIHFLELPGRLQTSDLVALEALKVGYTLSANIEPIGLVPRWDGAAGAAAWLTTEEPLLRIWADHPVAEFSLTINRQTLSRFPVGPNFEATVSLGQLPIGTHIVEVGGTTSRDVRTRLESERFEISIRAPTPWPQGVREQAGFRVTLDPPGATLNTVLLGKARICLIGPIDRSAHVEARFYDLNGYVTERIVLGHLRSIGDGGELQRIIAKLNKEPLAERVQTIPRVDIAFLVEELGIDAISFTKSVRPLRWRLSNDGQNYRVRLIDETGGDHPVSIATYGIDQPALKVVDDYGLYVDGKNVQAPGALFTAIYDNKQYSAIISVPARQRLNALKELGVAIAISIPGDPLKSIARLLSLRRLWDRPLQALGPLSLLRKAEVCEALERTISTAFCGAAWVARAHACRSLADPSVEQLKRDIGGSPGFGSRLRDGDWRRFGDDDAVGLEFARLAKVYGISDDPLLSQLALGLALLPAKVKTTAADKGVSDWRRLIENQSLMRGAYFARLVTKFQAQGDSSSAQVA